MKKLNPLRSYFLWTIFCLSIHTLGAQPDSALEAETLPVMLHYGLLKMEIEPSESLIILDGKYLDRNVWLISMQPGLHSLAVQRKGFKTYEKHFEISDGDRLSFSITLEKENGESGERVSERSQH